MDWNDVKQVVAKLAPAIATALGGPLAGAGVTALSKVFGLEEDGRTAVGQDELVAAISGATPDQLLALKKADLEFQMQMKALGFKNIEELERLATSDRDSARKREIEVRDKTPRNLAYSLVVGFFLVLGFMLFSDVPKESRDLLNIMLGMLGTSFVSVISYYFGSTSGSAEKTRLLAAASPQK